MEQRIIAGMEEFKDAMSTVLAMQLSLQHKSRVKPATWGNLHLGARLWFFVAASRNSDGK